MLHEKLDEKSSAVARLESSILVLGLPKNSNSWHIFRFKLRAPNTGWISVGSSFRDVFFRGWAEKKSKSLDLDLARVIFYFADMRNHH